VRFLGIPKNAQKLNSLVEDIRYVLMDYQVHTPKTLIESCLTSTADVVTTGHLPRRPSAYCEFYPLMVPPFVVTCK